MFINYICLFPPCQSPNWILFVDIQCIFPPQGIFILRLHCCHCARCSFVTVVSVFPFARELWMKLPFEIFIHSSLIIYKCQRHDLYFICLLFIFFFFLILKIDQTPIFRVFGDALLPRGSAIWFLFIL